MSKQQEALKAALAACIYSTVRLDLGSRSSAAEQAVTLSAAGVDAWSSGDYVYIRRTNYDKIMGARS